MAKTPLRVVVSGCCGRMGSLLIEEIGKDPAFQLLGGLEHAGHPSLGTPIPGHPSLTVGGDAGLMAKADLVIEFTTPEATLSHARTAALHKVPIVIGTTGLSPEEFEKLRGYSRAIPIFWSPNMSLGIVATRRLIHDLWKLLLSFGKEEGALIRLSETHHLEKKDKPSGTAKLLAREVEAATGRKIADCEIEAKREDDIVGIHEVHFEMSSEKITLRHEVLDRRVFAQGALTAAKFFLNANPKPGWYGMDDVVTFTQKDHHG